MSDATVDEVDLDEEVEEGNRLEGSVPRTVLEYLAKAIVDDPDSVVVEVDESRSTVSLRLNVSPDDMGRVIGRRGRTAQAIRTVVRAAAAREGMDVHVDIVD
ncbi:MAG TPA: KH domain-containing protein [Acidimicrobiales bacterium]|nr:KH domain-containing protein [Acidimicrobiales bacterium]